VVVLVPPVETARILLQHPGVRHWHAVVIASRAGLPLGPVVPIVDSLERREMLGHLEQ
jgi:hypothetical protein